MLGPVIYSHPQPSDETSYDFCFFLCDFWIYNGIAITSARSRTFLLYHPQHELRISWGSDSIQQLAVFQLMSFLESPHEHLFVNVTTYVRLQSYGQPSYRFVMLFSQNPLLIAQFTTISLASLSKCENVGDRTNLYNMFLFTSLLMHLYYKPIIISIIV